MGAYKDLRDELIDVVSGVQQNSHDAFVEVTGKVKEQFSGYPSATITPAEVESEYLTVAQNQRAYGFNIHIHYPIASISDWGDAIDVLLDLVDATLDALDKTIDLNGVSDFLLPAPLTWDVTTSGQQLELIATIHTVAKKDVNVQ